MAADIETQGGYPCKFVITPPGALLCQICQLVARDPQLSVCCGNNFCKTCLSKVNNDEGCPTCDDNEFFTTFSNKLSDREIKKLLIWCMNNEKGCGWRDELANLENHLQECDFQEIKCRQNCGVMIERSKMDDHLKNECHYRRVECEYCNLNGEYHVIVGQHKEECPKLPLSCPNECGLENIRKNELNEHLRKCPLQKVHCKYRSMGCEAKIFTGTQDEHDEVCMKEHFQMMRNELAQAKEELVDLKLRVGDREYYDSCWPIKCIGNGLRSNNNNGPQSVEERKQHGSIEEHVDGETPISGHSNDLHIAQKEFAVWKKQNSFLMDQILATMEWRTRLDVLSKLTDNPDLETTTPVIIKMTEVEVKKEFKMVYKSPTFLTYSNGHQICLCVLPSGKGSAVMNFSVNIMNMNKNDNDLNGTFTISLMNQLDDVEHCRTMLKYESNKELRSSVDGRVRQPDQCAILLLLLLCRYRWNVSLLLMIACILKCAMTVIDDTENDCICTFAALFLAGTK